MRVAQRSVLIPLLVATLLAGGWLGPRVEGGWAWGTVEHPMLARQAIELLPEPWRSFLRFYGDVIAHGSVYPDTTYLEKEGSLEQQRHYIDLEIWSPTNPSTGTLPYAVEAFFRELVGSLKQGDWDRALILMGRLSHYVADIHQPYHATKNYWPVTADGEALHSKLDRWLRDNGDKVEFVKSHPLTPIQNLTGYVFHIAWQSHSYLPILNNTLLDRGRNHTKGVGWTPELDSIMANRTNTAIISIARVWYTALLMAGVNPPTPPTNTPLRITIQPPPEVMGGALDPNERYDLRVEVRDALGVRVDADVRATITGVSLLVSPAPGELEPHGRYRITILPGQLKPMEGRKVNLVVTASRGGYLASEAMVDLEVGVAPQGPSAPAPPPYLIYAGVVAGAILLLLVARRLLVRRVG